MDYPKVMIHMKNFRSIKEQEVALAPLTVVYGPNGAGKSSLLYSLLTLKNIVLNPNQAPSGFFNYMFASLGGFEAVVFDHQPRNMIELGITREENGTSVTLRAGIRETNGVFRLEVLRQGKPLVDASVEVAFPYALNQLATQEVFHDEETKFTIAWNGITAQVQAGAQDARVQQEATRLVATINGAAEFARKVSVVPLGRGFAKPHYSLVPVTPLLVTEDEVATMLSNDKYLVSKVSVYLEDIIGHDFRVNMKPGTAIFSLDSTDKRTGVAAELVNEGFGINQMVFFLAKCLQSDAELIGVEEPEIHLHPTAVRALARALVRIVHDEGKRFLISTHSEAFMFAILNLVAEKKLAPEEMACYLAQKNQKVTSFERQAVNDKGQMEGGLGAFMEGELADMRAFLGVQGGAAGGG